MALVAGFMSHDQNPFIGTLCMTQIDSSVGQHVKFNPAAA